MRDNPSLLALIYLIISLASLFTKEDFSAAGELEIDGGRPLSKERQHDEERREEKLDVTAKDYLACTNLRCP